MTLKDCRILFGRVIVVHFQLSNFICQVTRTCDKHEFVRRCEGEENKLIFTYAGQTDRRAGQPANGYGSRAAENQPVVDGRTDHHPPVDNKHNRSPVGQLSMSCPVLSRSRSSFSSCPESPSVGRSVAECLSPLLFVCFFFGDSVKVELLDTPLVDDNYY